MYSIIKYLQVLRDTNVVQMSLSFEKLLRRSALVLEFLSVAGNAVLAILLNTLNGGHPTVYQV